MLEIWLMICIIPPLNFIGKKIFPFPTKLRTMQIDVSAYHFVIDFVEVYLANFIDDIFTLKRDKSEASMSVGLLIKHKHSIFNLKQI